MDGTLAYVRELYAASGFPSYGKFAEAAGFLPSTMSDWRQRKHVVSGLSLVRLLRAAAEQREVVPIEAAASTSPIVALHHRLGSVETALDDLRKAIEDLANRGERSDGSGQEHGTGG